ncbi:Predicted alpha/beta hydrolase BEM46 [Ceraceosorus bombacis]|uniref:Predicted alpha/beta hydrolase BEM46 n=1 Tax=Ceraceosorus bombacis TaxID=401625 RepID=A0A0P1BQ99_9BASI|nr:Predicted alpha/beta hydrolase BEM46 [Ceraceosorus bombacis]
MAWGIPTLWTLIRVLGGTFIGGFLVTAGLLYRYQNALIYPSSFPNGSRTNVLTPDEFDLEYEDVRLKTPDGQELRVYLMCQSEPSEREKRRGEDEGDVATRRPTILFLHANAGNMGHRLPLAAVFFKRFGCNVLMLSYRGYGLSTGTPSEKGIRIDAQTALNYIKRHPRLKATQVVAYGQSIGGAVAVDLAAKAGRAISALILENTFLSIPELIPHVLPPVKPFTFLCREFWPTGDSIMQLGPYQPVLFLSGRADELVPPSHMDLLFKRCSSSKKVWKSFKDGTHNDTCVKPGYFEAIAQFLATWVVPLTQGISPAELPDPDAHGTLPSPRTAEAALAPHSSYSKGGEKSGDPIFSSFGGFNAESGPVNPSGVGGAPQHRAQIREDR